MKNIEQASTKSARANVELTPPSITVRIGNRRLTMSWRPRKRLSTLLSGLLRRSWRQVLAPTLRVSVVAAAVCGAWQTQALAAAPAPGTLPSGWSVVNGNVVFTQNGNTLNINQLSPQAIANFLSFSIGSDAVVNISQPSAAAAFLAKVTGGDISQIYGKLTAPGSVVLFNPNGVLIGAGGVVDVGRFVATTLNINDNDFLAGKLTFARQGVAGSVENQGTIKSATGGSVYLIGSSVTNGGIIQSPRGEVILAAGETVTLADTATPGVTVSVTGGAGSVTNLGAITAEAGRIGIAAGLITNSGNISASSVVREGGRIFLRASSNLTTTANSSITADGTAGGNITLFADNKAYIDGDVSATGAPGQGGFVETSGLGSLDVVKVPTVGSGGTWYIDPYDLTVVAGLPGVGNSDVTFCGTNAVTSSGSSSLITNGTINTLLGLNTSVYLATGAGGSASGGNITINADIFSVGVGPTLSLKADRNILINANIDAGFLGALNLDLRTNYNGNVGGSHDVLVNGGSIKLNGGTFNVSDGSSLINTNNGNGNLSIAAGGTLDLSNYGTLNAGNVSIVGGSTLNLTNAGTVTAGNLTIDGLNSVAQLDQGGTVNAGNVTIGVNGKIDLGQGGNITAGNLSIAAHGNLTSTYNVVVNLTGTLENSGNLTLQNAAFNAATFNTTATGVSTLANTTGTMTAINNAGTLDISNIFRRFSSDALTNLAGGVLKLHASLGGTNADGVQQLKAIDNQGTLQLYNADGLRVGLLNNSGTLNVSGSVTTSGSTIHNSGALNVADQTTWSSAAGSFSNDGNITVTGSGAVNGIEAAALTNNGIITLAGGSMSFQDVYNGPTGSITGNGSIGSVNGFINDGILTPGGTGTLGSLTINGGGFTQNDSGEMRIDVGAADTDQIVFNTSFVHLGGTLRTGLLGGYQPALGDTFTPFTLVGGVGSLDNSYFHTVTGDVRTVSGAKQMLKATYGDDGEGMKLTMLGAATFYARGSGDWVDRESWSGSATNPDISVAYLPTQIDNVVINNVTASHASGSDTVDSLVVSGTGRLNMNGGDLTVSTGTSLTDSARLSLNSGNMSLGNTSIGNSTRLFVNAGNMTMSNASVNGEIDLSGGNLTLAGTTTGSGYITMTAGGGGEEGGGEGFNGFVVTDGPAKTLTMANALSDLSLQVMDGDFNYTGSVRLGEMTVYSGNVTGAAGSKLNVAENFYQGGGTINVDSAAFSTGQDQMTVGNITANNLVLEARNGKIVQADATSLRVKKQLIASAVTGIDLGRPGFEYTEVPGPENYIAAFAASNSGAGDITLINHLNTDDASVVTINGASTANGSINIENYGGMRTAAIGSNADFLGGLPMSSTGTEASAASKLAVLGINGSGQISVTNGAATLRTHSPLTIGAGGISATGGISLTAGTVGDPSSALVINGLLSTSGALSTVGNSVAVNANIVAASWVQPTNPVPTFGPGVVLNIAGVPFIPNPAAPNPNANPVASNSQAIQQQQGQQTQTLQNSVNTATVSSTTSTDSGVSQVSKEKQTTGGEPGTFGGGDGEEGPAKAKSSAKMYCS
ncbi:filamentous hemagglutinin N-terminal domain-containing protein [Herbaspirillum sp. WKF16]|uniref:beta strand repeat-containing protein n=1 Tax=Herbaspirillum sp. WKF16 TaxID=3028312 RepID=UPI0023A994E8|nr:filamentous hemagglutinin N-terminal domain-containing protein [Herbaspirillum sp. WKF16]WDZ96443.1 filamentous hemagglutinin N-terminal domain-containing protein [Herbaspirillum sp. WKF16]